MGRINGRIQGNKREDYFLFGISKVSIVSEIRDPVGILIATDSEVYLAVEAQGKSVSADSFGY
ncbi:hypothetical protein [Tetragenococcus koreensis]|uniref:Uncharacterized protein n=1 Tax=Tetragenococcus koreensis TaxID=290335 RepID=A0AAN4UBF6_9ENTE|nr:hypothetical protein [Tetragenococcus koreensis]MCF1631864.1 hypothetical protein [Tetragenococcus koreensis]MDN6164850.1 hypothetical protein [Tetragenococcus koreensis]MDN6384793.1 hypothetical protein [Tetragenococcus koreensis]MDN6540066.1 hypothetical protein [Tetragenococcus koreensis]MDN6578615.1 hypothetical protein [Tetragenococcus koreensis]